MCGIVGYVGQGQRDAVDVLMEGLHRLEYRGYDSAGLAIFKDEGIAIRGPLQFDLEYVPFLDCRAVGHAWFLALLFLDRA